MSDDASTLAPPAVVPAARPGAVLALTIAYHPDVARVGERAWLAAETEVSRGAPDFAAPGGGAARPLADRYLSRSPLVRIGRTADGVEIEAGTGTTVIVEGRAIAGAAVRAWQTYDLAALARGLVVELAERVVCVLHLALPDAPRAARHGLVGDSDAIEQVRADITRVADLAVPVLIRGETGTGKELVARALHAAGPRANNAFVGVNVAALPSTTAASELFGHVRGAFTGAAIDHDGLFARADGGSLFLDEIGETPLDVQPMLLRVLETREVTPLGSGRPRTVDVRLIAATEADLELQIAESGFREALFHRLAGYQLLVPPLRDRRDDVGRLFVHFLREELAATGDVERIVQQRDLAIPWLPTAVVARLIRHAWPGNVRQLRNAVRQLAIASRGADQARIDPALERLLAATAVVPNAPPADARGTEARRRDPASITDSELLEALRAAGWRPAAAAARLGVSRSTLYVLIDRSPRIRKAKDLPAAELRQALADHGGDVDATAAALEVSSRALKLRLGELGE